MALDVAGALDLGFPDLGLPSARNCSWKRTCLQSRAHVVQTQPSEVSALSCPSAASRARPVSHGSEYVRRCECVDCGGGAGSPRSLAVVDFESSAWTHVEGCRAAGQNSWHLCHEVRYADASGDAPETRALLQHASCSSSPRERSNDAYPRQLASALSPDVDIFLFGLCDASRRLRARHQPPLKTPTENRPRRHSTTRRHIDTAHPLTSS